MKDFLRKCYQEARIKGANARLYENRVAAIQDILEGDFFADEDWMLLAKWAIGAVDSNSVEKQMVALEEKFCETDPEYSNENEAELHILIGLLLYQYCEDTENLLLPSVIVCGHGVGWRLKCQPLYEKFLAFTDKARLSLRQLDQELFSDYSTTWTSFKSLKGKSKVGTAAEANGNAATDTAQDAPTADDLATVQEHLHALFLQNKALAFALAVQREESDILWWTLAEWSETRQLSYRDMTKDEAALFSAYELGGIVLFPLGPYASKQVLMRMISLGKAVKDQECVCAATLIDHLPGDILPSFEEYRITELQPILSALSAKWKAAQKGKSGEWRQYYEMIQEKDLNIIQMTPFDFGRQIYLEIELGRQLHIEGSGE